MSLHAKLTAKNYAERKPKIIKSLARQLKGKLAQDASLEGDFKGYRNVIQEARDAMDAPSQPSRPEFQLQ